jgi:hypothetical protein
MRYWFSITNLNRNQGFDLDDEDCLKRLANEIDGCATGGWSDVAGWRFESVFPAADSWSQVSMSALLLGTTAEASVWARFHARNGIWATSFVGDDYRSSSCLDGRWENAVS